MLICLVIFVYLSIKPKTQRQDIEKISEYLQNKYSEQFSDIEFLSTIQNEKRFGCDGSVWARIKIKDSYKHYYKAYSETNDIEFYVCINETKKDNKYYENIEDTYLGYLTRRNVANKILTEVNRTFNDLIEYSYVIKDSPKNLNNDIKSMKIKEELSRVSKQKDEYTSIAYYSGNTMVDTTRICFKMNLSFEELSENRGSDLLTLNQYIRSVNKDFEAITKHALGSIEIIIETSDGYDFWIHGNNNYILYFNNKENITGKIEEEIE